MNEVKLTTLLAPWRQISAKVDAFFAEVSSHHAEALQCRRGCALCCKQELSVMLVEALAVVAGLEELSDEARQELAARAARGEEPCVFLHQDACRIYDTRPLVCRSHGLPIRQQGEVASCELNFPEGHPAGTILDGGWITATLTIANGMLQRELQLEEMPRLPLRELAQKGRAALPDALSELLPPPKGGSPPGVV